MAYADFTLDRVEADFGLTTRLVNLFADLDPLAVPAFLTDWLDRNRQFVAIINEKSRSEFLVAPTLIAAQEFAANSFSIFSGQRLDVDVPRGLIGECDFILAKAPPIPRLKAPMFLVVEAKRGDIELALGQCAAQLVGARIFNERAGEGGDLFGCVTSGEVWQFLKLEQETIWLDSRRFYFNDLGAILAVLARIMNRV